jgi:glyoxylase-like metal-dependent hydrolase (beta-lactamase superfamily II)
MSIEWSNFPVVLEHHPGPTSGACWVILPEPKIIFVGDLVVRNQPPFLSSANLVEWLKSLDHLLAEFKDFTIVSGRSAVVPGTVVETQRETISLIHEQLETLSKNPAGSDSLDGIIPALMASMKAPVGRQKQYFQRLSYGLRHYFVRHYRSTSGVESDDE